MDKPKSRPEKRRGERDDLTGEHIIGDAGQLIFAILFFGVWITDSFFMNFSTQLNQIVPDWIRNTFGIVILIISGYCAFSGMKDYMREAGMWFPRLKKDIG